MEDERVRETISNCSSNNDNNSDDDDDNDREQQQQQQSEHTRAYVPPVYVSSYLPIPSTNNASGLEFFRRPFGSETRNRIIIVIIQIRCG